MFSKIENIDKLVFVECLWVMLIWLYDICISYVFLWIVNVYVFCIYVFYD